MNYISKNIFGLLLLLLCAVEIFSLPKVYITIVSHNEEQGADYFTNSTFYYANREFLRQVAIVIKNKNATWNIGSDWKFLRGVAKFDTGSVVINTNGKNILRWLVEDMGFQADPHAHQTTYNYADVAYLHSALGITPSLNASGFIYDPPDSADWEILETGLYGVQYPSYFWQPDLIWGAGTMYHQGNDDHSFGMWKPKDKDNFYVHDSTKHLVYLGAGCSAKVDSTIRISGVFALLDAIQNNQVPDTGFYTTRIFFDQASLNTYVIQKISDAIDQLQMYVNQNRLAWRNFTTTLNLWRNDYNSKPFRLDCSELPNGIKIIQEEIPENFILFQNYPNPFNPTTKIRFSIPARNNNPMADVKLIVFDALGREVATLVNDRLSPGTYETELNGSELSSGIYYYKLTTSGYSDTKKMILTK